MQATVSDKLTPDEILAVETVWGPLRAAGVAQLLSTGIPCEQIPQHWDWDWKWKVPKLSALSYRCIGILVGSEVQGLMLLTTADHATRLPIDLNQPLVYIEYIESAPWNVGLLAGKPRFGGVGKQLIRAAVQASRDEGFQGRIGLHSLSQSEIFYEQKCGMIRLGGDDDYDGLEYFEMTSERANIILNEA